MSEQDLMLKFREWVQAKMRPGYLYMEKCCFYGQSIDAVIMRPNFVVAFEAKLTNWRRCTEQLLGSRPVANYGYAVMPQCTAAGAAHLAHHGFGLLVFDGVGFTITHPAKRSPCVFRPCQTQYLNTWRDMASWPGCFTMEQEGDDA
jgi:hypothetical protein